MKAEIQVRINYLNAYAGRVKKTIAQIWESTEFHCLECGLDGVWTLPDSSVDYGGGDLHVCINCHTSWYGYIAKKEPELSYKIAIAYKTEGTDDKSSNST